MERKFTKDHEWITVEGNIGTIGISDYAQKALGDVVFVSLIRDIGEDVERGDEVAEIESVKSVGQVYAPVDGKVIEFNSMYEDESNSGTMNKDPYGKGWIAKIEISDNSQLDDLMNDKEYEEYIAKL